MVGFVVGEVALEEMEVASRCRRSSPVWRRQQEHGADATGTEALHPIGQFVVDVTGGNHGPIAFRSGPIRGFG